MTAKIVAAAMLGVLALSAVVALPAQASAVSVRHGVVPSNAPTPRLGAPRTVTIIDGDGANDRALSEPLISRLEPGVLADANSYVTSWWGVRGVRFANVDRWTSARADHLGWRIFLTSRGLAVGELGYHAVDSYGPYAVVSVSAARRNGTPVSLAVSHELNEMMVDPRADEVSSDGFYVEVVDPVADVYSMLDGVAVADFVTPNWLAWKSNGIWDAAGALSSDHSTTPGGYTMTTFLKTRDHEPAHLRRVALRLPNSSPLSQR